jgi:hypothetical protein
MCLKHFCRDFFCRCYIQPGRKRGYLGLKFHFLLGFPGSRLFGITLEMILVNKNLFEKNAFLWVVLGRFVGKMAQIGVHCGSNTRFQGLLRPRNHPGPV